MKQTTGVCALEAPLVIISIALDVYLAPWPYVADGTCTPSVLSVIVYPPKPTTSKYIHACSHSSQEASYLTPRVYY